MKTGAGLFGTKCTIDPTVSRPLAVRMIEHIRFHSTRLDLPTLYQFELPDNCVLSIEDQVSKGGRLLICWVVTGNSVGYPVSVIKRARGTSAEAAWFDGMPAADVEKAVKKIVDGIEWAHRNRHLNGQRRRFAAVIDPSTEPAPITQPPGKRPGSWD